MSCIFTNNSSVLFLICALLQFLVFRHHQKEKKYGPSPANNYTSGSGKRKFWQRKQKTTKDAYTNGARDTEMGNTGTAGTAGTAGAPTLGTGAVGDGRTSAETGYT